MYEPPVEDQGDSCSKELQQPESHWYSKMKLNTWNQKSTAPAVNCFFHFGLEFKHRKIMTH